jgi:hypothetical protein
VPAAAPKAVPAVKNLSPDEPPPLFANTPAHLLATAAPQAEVHPTPPPARKPSRPLRPAGPRPRWRTFGLLFVLLGSMALLIGWLRQHPGAPTARSISSNAPAASRPSTHPVTLATSPKTRAAPATAPLVKPRQPVLASASGQQDAVAQAVVVPPLPTYTPVAAPVGFIGFDRVEIGGRFHIDSYDASTETYAGENAHGAALLLSNGPIHLSDTGDVQETSARPTAR